MDTFCHAMKRRDFIKTSLAAGAAVTFASLARAAAQRGEKPIPRRSYKDGIELSVIGFGGIVLVGHSQPEANDMVAEMVDRGINYYDVAPSYGDGQAEERLGPALGPHRTKVFLACKTTKRDAPGAQEELDRSLQRLQTDHFDLYQFHGVSKREEVDAIFSKGGAAETFIKARDQGKVRYLGFSAHSEDAALAMLDRMAFDSILFPINFICYARGNFGPRVVQRAKEKGVARLALKTLAYTPWPKDAKRTYPKCWYRPIEDRALALQALRFTLSEDITAAIPPGDARLFRMAVDLAAEFTPLSARERTDLLASTRDLQPLFKA